MAMLAKLSAIARAIVAIAAAALAPDAVRSQQDGPPLSWTDWADLALQSPVILSARVNDVDRAPKAEQAGLPPGQGRALVRSGLVAALKAPSVLPAEAAWMWQGPVNSRGQPPFARKDMVLVFGSALSGGGNPAVLPLRLTGAAGQQTWSAEAEEIVRDVLRQAGAPGATGLLVTALRDGFRSEGEVAGVSESQFFLTTESGGLLTVRVRRNPGAEPEVAVATGDLVDRAVKVAPRTLLWRGLACGMPAGLAQPHAADRELAADYAAAKASIGPCGRTLAEPG
ncbi:MAG: hypothetical protein ACRC1J_10510 [Sandaracinobacteroides sp.]